MRARRTEIMDGRAARGGFTLVEVMIASALVAVIALAVVVLATSSNNAVTTAQESTDSNFSLRQALGRISNDLRQSSPPAITIVPGTDYDSVDLQMPVSYTGSTITWGASGIAGWHVQVLVDGDYGHLVRRVVDSAGTRTTADEVLARNVDASFEGFKGFSVVTDNDGLYQVSLRVVAQSGHGPAWRRTETTTVHVRN